MTVAVIRVCAPADQARLHEIRQAAFPAVFASFRSLLGPGIAAVALANAEAEQRELLDSFFIPQSGKLVLVACLDSTPIGFAALSFDDTLAIGEIVLTAVDPTFAGRGFGTQLAEAALQSMKAAGMRVATVGTGGDDSHAAARRTYHKAGFARAIPNILYYRALDDGN